MTVDEAVAKARALYEDKLRPFMDAAKDATPELKAAADTVRAAFMEIAAKQGENVDDLMMGDPITDRATLESAELIDAMHNRIDWAAIPEQAYVIAKALGPALVALA